MKKKVTRELVQSQGSGVRPGCAGFLAPYPQLLQLRKGPKPLSPPQFHHVQHKGGESAYFKAVN